MRTPGAFCFIDMCASLLRSYKSASRTEVLTQHAHHYYPRIRQSAAHKRLIILTKFWLFWSLLQKCSRMLILSLVRHKMCQSCGPPHKADFCASILHSYQSAIRSVLLTHFWHFLSIFVDLHLWVTLPTARPDGPPKGPPIGFFINKSLLYSRY